VHSNIVSSLTLLGPHDTFRARRTPPITQAKQRKPKIERRHLEIARKILERRVQVFILNPFFYFGFGCVIYACVNAPPPDANVLLFDLVRWFALVASSIVATLNLRLHDRSLDVRFLLFRFIRVEVDSILTEGLGFPNGMLTCTNSSGKFRVLYLPAILGTSRLRVLLHERNPNIVS